MTIFAHKQQNPPIYAPDYVLYDALRKEESMAHVVAKTLKILPNEVAHLYCNQTYLPDDMYAD